MKINGIMPSMMSVLVLIMVCTGCAGFFPSGELEGPVGESKRGFAVDGLAGTWEYQEGGGLIYQLVLDQHGRGTYDWQEGSFETIRLSHGEWGGTWHQSGNDREGGFEAHLSDDRRSAQGRWWYTRIGDDREPVQPGGVFTLTRQPALGLSPGTLLDQP